MARIAGPYASTYKSVDTGEVERGFDLIHTPRGEPLIGDDYGDAIQDVILTGSDYFMVFTLQEFLETHNILMTLGVWGDMGQTGRLAIGSSVAGALALDDVAGTTAAGVPATLSAAQAIIAEDFDMVAAFSSTRLRNVPVRMRLLPTAGVAFTFT